MRKNRHLPLISFIGLIVLSLSLIFLFDQVEKKFDWQKDLSFNAYASTTAYTKDILKNIDSPVELYSFFNDSHNDVYLKGFLKNYNKINEFIHYKNIDLARQPEFFSKFKTNENEPLSADNIVVYSPSNNKYKVLNVNDFIQIEFDLEREQYRFGNLKYEKSITEAIMFVSKKNTAVVYITQGHGELPADKTLPFIEQLQQKGVVVKFIKQIDEPLEKNALIFISNPKADISESELRAVSLFEKQGGSLLIALNSDVDTYGFKHFKALLDSFGVSELNGIVKEDELNKASYYQTPFNSIPYMQENDVLLPLILSNKNILVMPKALAFEIKKTPNVQSEILLKSGENASLVDANNSTEIKQSGTFSLGVYAQKVNENTELSKMVVLGSNAIFGDEELYSLTFSKEFINAILQKLLPEKMDVLNIPTKPSIRPNLRPNNTLAINLLIYSLPLVIFLIGYAVVHRRRLL